MIAMNCPICNGNRIRLALKAKSFLGEVRDIYECELCDTRFIHPIPLYEELNRLYEQYYKENETAVKHLANPDENRKYWQRQWSLINRMIDNRKRGKVLDIGCGGGTFYTMLELAGRNMGLNFQKTQERLLPQKGFRLLQHLKMQLFLMVSLMW